MMIPACQLMTGAVEEWKTQFANEVKEFSQIPSERPHHTHTLLIRWKDIRITLCFESFSES
jgi:hypothetical protein